MAYFGCRCAFFYVYILLSVFFRWLFFFFKQKTAYEMRISDWSSDVCSSDLRRRWRMAGRCSGRLAARADAVRRTAGSACGACDAWSRAGQHATADLAGDVNIARSPRPVAYRRARDA